MSWFDGLVEDNEALSQDQRLDRTNEKLKPGFFTGALDPLGPNTYRGVLEGVTSVESGLSTVWQGGLNAAASLLLPEPKFGGTPNVTSAEESSQEALGQGVGEMAKAYRPDPTEVGIAGQIIGEAAAILPRTLVGAVVAGPAGAAVAAGGPAGYSRKRTAMEEGIDESTATWLGVTEGVVTGVGAALPAAGFAKTLIGDAGLSVSAVVGLGMAHRGSAAALLETNGYHAQAAQYKVFDRTAVLTDLFMGLGFFGIGRVAMRRPTTEQIDAVLAERNSQHADIDTAPGLPIDPRSAVAHQDALRAAINSINRGEAVVLPDNIQSASFLRAGDESPVIAPSRDQALASAREELLPVVRAEAEQAAAGSLANVRDIRAELATVSKTLDDLDSTFRAKAKEFQGQGLGRKKAEQSARKAIAEERSQLVGRQSELNDRLAGNRSAEQARADLNALDRGELPARFDERFNARSDEIIQGFQRKPLADGVAAAKRTMTPRQINERAARDELDVLVREYEATLPREPVEASAPKPDLPPGGKPAATKVTTPDKSGPEVVSGGGKPDGEGKPATRAEPVELQLLRDSVNRNPDTVVNSGFDADGMPLQAKAADVLADIEAEHRAGVRESQSYLAAISCLLR
ncbi:hypothetical protein QN369_13465 [Pseudomonas sp. CCI1.4]|nr:MULTISPECIES: hypothetical protein [unclassified Pseudomonas]MEB0067055.1 hypothetical protein [Pseudomonas sp. CCI3.1]MEB0073007.1 hypothetical protein [Pseudomonas sp. CCI1.4]